MSDRRLWTWRDDEDDPAAPPPRRPPSSGEALAAARAAGPIVTDRIDPEALPSRRPPSTAPGPDEEEGEAEPDGGGDAPGGEGEAAGRSRWGRTWSANLGIERVLATGMFACCSWSLTQALRSAGLPLSQTFSLFALSTLFFAIGIALGGHPGGRNYRRYTDYGLVDWFFLLVPIVLLVRLLPPLLEGPGALARDVGSWVDDPIRFWNAGLAWALIVLFFVWDGALSVANSLGTLSFQTAESLAAVGAGPAGTAPAARGPDWDRTPYRFADHAGAWRHLMRLFIFGGCLVLLFTGLSLVDPDELGNPDRPQIGGVMPVVLLYFLLGLILASQTSLDRLRAGWLRGGVQIQSGLARRWLGYSAILMGLGLLLALLLPTSFSDAAADQLPGIWRVLWAIQLPFTLVFRLMEVVIGGLAALLFAPFSLLFPRGEAPAGGVAGVFPTPTALPLSPGPAPGASQGLGARILWGLLLYVLPTALVLYVAWNTWRKRRTIWRDVRVFSRALWRLLRDAAIDFGAALWRLFSFGSPRLLNLAPRAIQERIRRRLQARRGAGAGGRSGWLRLRDLSPRDLVQYFYVSLLQRAEGLGWKRDKGQTPYEYGRDLVARLPDRKGEVEAITEAYVRARYSPAPVSPSDAQRARGPWQRLRDALQTRRRSGTLTGWLFGRE